MNNLPLKVDALLNQNPDLYWNNGNFGEAVSVTYNFPNPSFFDAYPSHAFSAPQQSYAIQALRAWSDVANITFIGPGNTADDSDIQFRLEDPHGTGGDTFYPHVLFYGGDVFISSDNPPAADGYGFQTLIHEIGHALGLKHPGNYNAGGGGTEGPYLPPAADRWVYSVMSYHQVPGDDIAQNPPAPYYVITPMLYDVEAIQYVYGANLHNHMGDDSYLLTPNVMETIWDTGGTDTISVNTAVTTATLDLRPGYITYLNGVPLDAIAFNPTGVADSVTAIENATGSSGGDYIIGNGGDNILRGNGGDDTLEGNWGNDTIYGDDGTDTAVFYGPKDSYHFVRNPDGSAKIVAYGPGATDGTDTLYTIEKVIFDNVTYNLADLLPPLDMKWSRLSEQIFRVDKWSLCRG